MHTKLDVSCKADIQPSCAGMTLQGARLWLQDYLAKHSFEHPQKLAGMLLMHCTGLDNLGLFCNGGELLNEEQIAFLHDALSRMVSGEPIQYITGRAAFRHLQLQVAKGVLIPRPETEVLVSEALDFVRQLDAVDKLQFQEKESRRFERFAQLMREFLQSYSEEPKTEIPHELKHYPCNDQGLPYFEERVFVPHERIVCDVCCGSACIALSCAFECSSLKVIGLDIDDSALKCAQANIEEYELESRVKLLKSDLLAEIPSYLVGSLDLIISNPPYIPSAIIDTLPDNVRNFEPRIALDGGDDGLCLFRTLCKQSFQVLSAQGAFFCELHEDCLEEAEQFALECGFSRTKTVKDLAGRPRILNAYK